MIIKTYKNYPVTVRARKNRYNYFEEVFSSDVSKTFNITLQLFEGLDYSIVENKIDTMYPRSLTVKTNDKKLWNNEQYIGTSHVLAPINKTYLTQKRVYNNFIKKNEEPIIDENGVMSNITGSNNILTTFKPGSTDWSIHVTFVTPATFNKYQYIFGDTNTNRQSPNLYVNASGALILMLSENGTGWNIADNVTVGQVEPNSVYSVVLTYDGTKYSITLNDEVTWELTSSLIIYQYYSKVFSIGADMSSYAWTGSIDLSKTYILVNGATYWTPYKGEGTLQKGCLETGLNDTTEEKSYTAFVKPEGDLILSESDADKEGYVWANTVTVPAHVVTSNPYIANFNIVGTDVKIYDCAASGFSDSSWITTNVTIPYSEFYIPEAIRLISKVKPLSVSNTRKSLWMINTDSENDTYIGARYDDMLIKYDGSDIVGSTNILNDTDSFWTQTVLDTTGIKVYVLKSDAESFEELPTDLSQWVLNVQSSGVIHDKIKTIEIGTNSSQLSMYNWLGEIDLLNTRIDVKGSNGAWSLLWKPIIIT